MTPDLPKSPMKRPFSLSIGQLTFGSFLLVLAVIIITSTASVIAIRHHRFDLCRTAAAAERRRPRRGHRPPHERTAARGARFRHRSGHPIGPGRRRRHRADRAPEEDPAGARPRTAGHDRRRHRAPRDLPQRHRADLDADQPPRRTDRGVAAAARQASTRRSPTAPTPISRRRCSEIQSRIAAGAARAQSIGGRTGRAKHAGDDDRRSGAAHRGRAITPTRSSRYRSGSGRSPISTRRCWAPKGG